MKNILISIIIFSILSGCKSKNDNGKLYTLETIQNNTVNQFYYGEERIMVIKEMVYYDDSGNEEFRSRIKLMFKSFLKIDSLTGVLISEMGKMKKEMFKSFDENMSLKNENSIVYYDYKNVKSSRPLSFDLSNVKYVGESNLLSEKNRNFIIKSIRKYRKEICCEIEKSIYSRKNTHPYFFIDPQINDFKDDKDFNKKYERKIKKSKISIDDYEGIKQIYRLLSKTDEQWNLILNEKESWIDDLGVLLSIERDIMMVRSFALDQIGSRIGCRGNYNFSHILPIVEGPNAAVAGDTVELKILMAFFNAYQNPTFEIFGGGKLEKIEKGIGYFKVVIPKSKEIEFKGNITLKNKSGIPHSEIWKHKIKILHE